ncbi:hypothetical protein OF83DRAFT_1127183 [Amylostereum chailletii]|nr:hypothetical protein OF83DRAFT_1127183 [Amylostereum chailletii]
MPISSLSGCSAPLGIPVCNGEESVEKNLRGSGIHICLQGSSARYWATRPQTIPTPAVKSCQHQLKFLEGFRTGWTLRPFEIPESWIDLTYPMARERATISALSPLLDAIRDDVAFLPEDEVMARHDNIHSFKPDFLLHRPLSFAIDYISPRAEDIEDALIVDPVLSLFPFYQTVMYSGDSSIIESVLIGAFLSFTGGVVHRRTAMSYPTILGGTQELLSGEFALSCAQTVNFHHPALVVGIPGPCSEEPPVAAPAAQGLERLRDLVQPNLIAHALHWILHPDQSDGPLSGATSPPGATFPPWFMLFGLSYDDKSITLVAHIPFLESKCQCEGREDGPAHISSLSCVVDSVPFPGLSGSSHASSEIPFVDNMKVALLLYAVQRQAFRMALLWDDANWSPHNGPFSSYPDDGPERPRSPSACSTSDDESLESFCFVQSGEESGGDAENKANPEGGGDLVEKWRQECYRLLNEN